MIREVFLRTGHNYDMDKVSEETGLLCDEPGVTQQEFKDECDINEIVRRFGLTGDLPDQVRVPVSGDFTNVTDYASAMLAVRQAEEAFMELPAELRAKFQNDPQVLMDFVGDDANYDEAKKLGLLKADAVLVKGAEAAPPVVPSGEPAK